MPDLKTLLTNMLEGLVQAVILGLATASVVLLIITPFIPPMMLNPHAGVDRTSYNASDCWRDEPGVVEVKRKYLSVFDEPTCARIVWIKSARVANLNQPGHIHMMADTMGHARRLWADVNRVRDELVCIDDLYEMIHSHFYDWDDHETMTIMSRLVDRQFVEEMWYRQNENLLHHLDADAIESIITAGLFGSHKFDEALLKHAFAYDDALQSMTSPGFYGLVTPSSGPIVERLLARRLADAHKLDMNAFWHELDYFLRAYARLAPIYRFEDFFNVLMPNLHLFVLGADTEWRPIEFEVIRKPDIAIVVALSNEDRLSPSDKRLILEAYVPRVDSFDMMVVFHQSSLVQICGGGSATPKRLATGPPIAKNPLEI